VTYLWLALGGGLGTAGRYALAGWVDGRLGPGPLGIFVVNILGSFLIGFLGALAEERFFLPLEVRRFLAIGVLGGFTTFSTLSYETLKLVQVGSFVTAAGNSVGSIVVGLAAAYLGFVLGRLI
jgi:fluoride exporter